MTYEQAKQKAFATGIIPNGYFGETVKVRFTFAKGTGETLVVAPCGYYRYNTPTAVDQAEAWWLLNNHPTSNAKNLHEIKASL